MTGREQHVDDDRPHNLADCMLALGITPDIRDELFVDCDSLEDEFKIIKTLYRAKILEDHPDKVRICFLRVCTFCVMSSRKFVTTIPRSEWMNYFVQQWNSRFLFSLILHHSYIPYHFISWLWFP